MRVTYRGTRNYNSNKHNDRDFDIDKANHIDPVREKGNFYWHSFSSSEDKELQSLTFREAELEHYKRLFSSHLKHQNDKHKSRRQYGRIREMEDVLKNKNTRPEEFILQIGNMKNNPGNNFLGTAWVDLFKKMSNWNEKNGKPFRLLNFALHGDEATPHIHAKRVWVAKDPETGFSIPRQELALEQAGVPLPDPSKPKSRTNNRKITFDKMVRGWWQEICINRGLDIVTEPLPARRHKDKETFIDEQIQAKQVELERLTANVEVAKRLEMELEMELAKNQADIER